MTTFWSCHLIVDRKLPDYCKHIRDFIDADFYRWRGFSTLFFNGLHPKTLIFCLTILLILGKR